MTIDETIQYYKERAEEYRQLAELLKESKQIKEQIGWIPVSEERLPKAKIHDSKCSDWVMVTKHIGKDNDVVGKGFYSFTDKRWYSDILALGIITAWMPLIKPYRVGGNGETQDKSNY